ncbi:MULTISPECIES: hypothetical protein [Streptomyces]|uniref:SH3 domain-containing protein n=1 Tax=Streptomyces albus (strain ATCC 21838 / DSM 41398 / FERM P-419 / JCM 4703 / NBRC 107858) TaxID=1081613 RepID=A0A0B5F4N2_STRA4|nr:hypothetical protein [Streptomyces sp. SCSIO ZS0520]AJE86560.1 hypothetical protein SLNWT_6184 [Streptomyces albus]AOU80864.1 hypothetical protein SLNHY_6173 [Streptomyces albus]AYN36567.1 hypothetical protein DUI70_6073 [Streptomyces albus]
MSPNILTRRPRARAGAIAAVLGAAALLLGSATSAQAANGTIGERETVCATDLFVRTQPVGAWMGTLHQGQTFLVESKQGSWVYGFAYGDVNRKGWVQDGWFC